MEKSLHDNSEHQVVHAYVNNRKKHHPHQRYELDYRWVDRLMQLQKNALYFQYQLACLNTLGGAYHLCNKPKVALRIATSQLQLGHLIVSPFLVIRALLYQYVNLSLLNKYKEAKHIYCIAKQQAVENASNSLKMIELCEITKSWVEDYIAEQKNDSLLLLEGLR